MEIPCTCISCAIHIGKTPDDLAQSNVWPSMYIYIYITYTHRANDHQPNGRAFLPRCLTDRNDKLRSYAISHLAHRQTHIRSLLRAQQQPFQLHSSHAFGHRQTQTSLHHIIVRALPPIDPSYIIRRIYIINPSAPSTSAIYIISSLHQQPSVAPLRVSHLHHVSLL